jgi:hypothetical protein
MSPPRGGRPKGAGARQCFPSTRCRDYVAGGARLGTFGFRLGRERRDISTSPKPPSSPLLRGDT